MLMLPVFAAILCLSSASPTTTVDPFTIDYHQLVELKDDPDYLLIDVRQPGEWFSDGFGYIPGAINMPIDTVIYVLTNMSKEAFKLKYGRDKPELNSNIIFSCTYGIRSAQAQRYANDLGYTRVFNYAGGISDYHQHQQ